VKIVIPRACRAPLVVIGERERRQREVAIYRASKTLGRVTRRALERGEAREEPEREDGPRRAHPLRIGEILGSCRCEFDGLSEEARAQFLEVVSLFAAGRVTNSEWRATVRAARASYEATLPAAVPPRGGIKAKDRPYTPPQGW
jgi:hypothetical protein